MQPYRPSLGYLEVVRINLLFWNFLEHYPLEIIAPSNTGRLSGDFLVAVAQALRFCSILSIKFAVETQAVSR